MKLHLMGFVFFAIFLIPINAISQSCSYVNCYREPSIEARQECIKSDVACMNQKFEQKIAKWRDGGAPKKKKVRMISKLEKNIQKYIYRGEDMAQTVKTLQEQLKLLNNLKTVSD